MSVICCVNAKSAGESQRQQFAVAIGFEDLIVSQYYDSDSILVVLTTQSPYQNTPRNNGPWDGWSQGDLGQPRAVLLHRPRVLCWTGKYLEGSLLFLPLIPTNYDIKVQCKIGWKLIMIVEGNLWGIVFRFPYLCQQNGGGKHYQNDAIVILHCNRHIITQIIQWIYIQSWYILFFFI